jgi:hypothetical protein
VNAPDFPPFNADPDSLPDRVDNPERIQIYHDDAMLEFPQSGEQFEGVATLRSGAGSILLTWTKVRFRIRGHDECRSGCRRADCQLRRHFVAPGCPTVGVLGRQGGA